MKKIQITKNIIFFTVLFFIFLQLLALLISFFNYMIGSYSNIDNYTGKAREIISQYFKEVNPVYKTFYNSHDDICRYIVFYIISVHFILKKYNENKKTLFVLLFTSIFMMHYFYFDKYVILHLLVLLFCIYYIPYNIFIGLILLYVVYYLNIEYYNYYTGKFITENINKYGAKPYDISNLTKDVYLFLKKKKFNRLYITTCTDQLPNMLTIFSNTGDIIIMGKEYKDDPISQYVLIHEYGHIYNQHGIFAQFRVFFLRLFIVAMTVFLPIALTTYEESEDMEKKLHLLILYYLIHTILSLTFIKLYDNVTIQHMEWQADNYVVEQGFRYELAKHLILLVVKFSNFNFEHFCTSTLLNVLHNQHPTTFMRILNIFRIS